MKIAFQKNPTTIFSKLICWWTKSPYYHCEIIFSCGSSFSAIPEKNKTRFAWIEYNENWDIVDLPFDSKTKQKILEWCNGEVDCKYDFIGILFTQIIPLSFQNPWWWFCSEVCMSALQQGGWFQHFRTFQYDPGELYNLVLEKKKDGEKNE